MHENHIGHATFIEAQEDTPDVPKGIDILYPPDLGKTHLTK